MWRILMNICRPDGAFLLHWEVWLATLVSPPLNISPFCSVFAPRVTIINTPIHSHLISDKAELFSENLKPFLLMLHHSSVWYSRLIHEYLIFPSDSFVTNFDVSLNCHKFHISAFSSIPANFPITGTHVSNSKKVKLVTFSEIGIQLSGKVDFPQTVLSEVILAVYEVAVLNISNIHKVTKALLPALPSIKALWAGGQT